MFNNYNLNNSLYISIYEIMNTKLNDMDTLLLSNLNNYNSDLYFILTDNFYDDLENSTESLKISISDNIYND